MLESLPLSSIFVWLYSSILILAILLGISKLSSYLAFRQAQRWLAQNKTLIHEYAASSDLAPVEFGYLFDRKFRDNELFALLISMHQSKIIKLSLHKGEIIFEQIPHRNPRNNLSMIELEVLSYLKSQGGSGLWSDYSSLLRAGNETHERFERFVHNDLEDKGYFVPGTIQMYRRLVTTIQYWLGALLSILFVLFPIYQSYMYSQQALGYGFAMIDQLVVVLVLLIVAILFWPIWYFYIGFAAEIIYHGSGIPYGSTKKLKDNWRIVYGYKVFLQVVEKNRLALDPDLNDPILPWSIAAELGPSPEKL